VKKRWGEGVSGRMGEKKNSVKFYSLSGYEVITKFQVIIFLSHVKPEIKCPWKL
jgi:hypothetical protein